MPRGAKSSSEGPHLAQKLPLGESLLTTAQAARLTRLSMSWFERKRWEGRGPPFYRVGRSVRYVRHELLAWFEKHRVTPEGDSSI